MDRILGWLSVMAILLSAPAFLAAEEAAPPGKVKVDFAGTDLLTFAQQVERMAGKTFIYQEDLLRNKKVNLRAERPISPEELYRVFQSICLMNGFVLVPAEGTDLNLVKIVQAREAAKEPGAQPVLVKGQPLPPGDTLVTYLLSTRHIAPSRALAVLNSATSTTGSAQQIQGTELILITDVATAIQRIEKLLALIDIPGPPVISLAVELKHLAAGQGKSQATEYMQAYVKASAGGEPGRAALSILADERLNTIHLVGPVNEVHLARDFLSRLDREAPAALKTIGYYRLKNVPVAEIVDVVRQLLGLAVSAREAERKAQAEEGLPSPLAGRPSAPLAGGPRMPPTVTPPGPAPRAEEPAAGRAPAARKRATQAAAAAPAAGARTDIEVLPIEGQNTLVVIGDKTVHEEVKGILDHLDTRKGQILMEVAIVQVSGDDSLETGLEILYQYTMNNGSTLNAGTGFGLGTMADPGGVGFPTQQNLKDFSGSAIRYLKPGELSALLRIVASKSNVNIVSQPLLLVNDNEEANFTTKVSEPTVAISQGTATTTTSFAGFAEAVTNLKIRPTISPDGYINLRITQDFEEFTGSAAAVGVPPPKTSNNVSTLITVPDQQTVVMGGFTRDTSNISRSGIPFLMDVPLLKYAVSHESTRVTKSRLYLFVRPRILAMDGFGDLARASREKRKDVERLAAGSPIEPEIKEALLPIGTGAEAGR